ncbi:hypothetical protein HDV01_001662, partial [Terramyces sp. JEL0728]
TKITKSFLSSTLANIKYGKPVHRLQRPVKPVERKCSLQEKIDQYERMLVASEYKVLQLYNEKMELMNNKSL